MAVVYELDHTLVIQSPSRSQEYKMQSMKQNATLVILSAFLLGLMGCNFGAPSNEATKVPTLATATVAQRAEIIISASSPTVITEQAVSKGDGGIAPPYEEIKRTIIHIVYGDEQGEGPEMGDDGIVDAQIGRELYDYDKYLQGRSVQNWEGWVSSFTQSDVGNPHTDYNLGVFMQEPKPGEVSHDGPELLRVPRQQMEKLQLQVNLEEGFGTWKTAWPRVRFSGTIGGIFHNGGVLIEDVTIESIK